VSNSTEVEDTLTRRHEVGTELEAGRHVDAKLVVIGGEAQNRQYDLVLPTIIGRSRSTDLTLRHPLVSRHHCEVFEADGMLMVRDLGSLNGTFLGQERIAEQAMPVKSGDVITVGPVTFRAVYADSGRHTNGAWNANGPTVDGPMPEGLNSVQDSTTRPRPKPADSDDAGEPGK
jgi:predicted component of type VI protein secretion system